MEILEKDHPFPNDELMLLMKLKKENLIPIKDLELILSLLAKYLHLRSHIFNEQ